MSNYTTQQGTLTTFQIKHSKTNYTTAETSAATRNVLAT